MERVHIYDACLYWIQYKFSVMTDNERKELTEKVEVLKKQKESISDWMEQMSVADEIHNIEMKLNGVKPTDSHIDCIGCGS